VQDEAVHQMFQGQRKHGEWFYWTFELGEYIDGLIKRDREEESKTTEAVTRAYVEMLTKGAVIVNVRVPFTYMGMNEG